MIGVNEISDDFHVSIFPNPSTGVFTLINSEKQFQIEIYNALYEKVYSNSALRSNSQIDISSQPAGIFLK